NRLLPLGGGHQVGRPQLIVRPPAAPVLDLLEHRVEFGSVPGRAGLIREGPPYRDRDHRDHETCDEDGSAQATTHSDLQILNSKFKSKRSAGPFRLRSLRILRAPATRPGCHEAAGPAFSTVE